LLAWRQGESQESSRATATPFNRVFEAKPKPEDDMPKFIIEREVPGAGKLSAAELKAISQKSCGVLREMGPRIQWLESYVTGDKIYCVYIAPDEQTIREHATRGGFPANQVNEVKRIIDPTTAD
jgi:uncharacterized protein DUF4242